MHHFAPVPGVKIKIFGRGFRGFGEKTENTDVEVIHFKSINLWKVEQV